MSTPKLHVRLNRHQDGTKYVSLQRGSWSWMKISLTEIPTLCNELMDIYEQENK